MTLAEFIAVLNTPEGLAAAVGFILSFLVELVPGFKTWWEGLRPAPKRLAFFFLSLVITGAVTAIGFAPAGIAEQVWQFIYLAFIAGGVGTLVHTRKMAG